MSYCLRGRELLLDLQRSDWLPPYDNDGVRSVISEIEELWNHVNALTKAGQPGSYPNEVKTSLAFFLLCQNRNKRYLLSYLQFRLRALRRLRWETGPVLPPNIGQDTLAARSPCPSIPPFRITSSISI